MSTVSRLLTMFLVALVAFGGGSGIVMAQGTPEGASPAASPAAVSTTCLPESIPEKDSYLIGMSQANEGEPWRQAMNDQIEAAAAEHPELEVVFADAAQDNATQVADVEGFLQQGIDLLIISPNEAAPLTDVVAQACAEGVPVIVLDRRVNGEEYTMWIGADNTLIGQMAGEYTASWCEEENHDPCLIGELRGLEGSTPAQERGDGFRLGIESSSAIEIAASQNADWLRELAIPASQAMFQANPDLNVIYAHNDPMAEAAIISAENQGLDPESILFIGIDGLPTPDGGLRSVADGRLDVTYVYPTGGQEAIDWTVNILNGETPPREVVLETIEVTEENAQDVLEQFGAE
ncbi:MAG: substrate-binding domain-containing protein [Chloroflexota bacterium]|nr:substrate-binding domain-containing protein [Chloroflexota bacterium]